MLYHKAFKITPEEVQFDNSYVYTDALLHGLSEMTLYQASQVDAWSYPGSDKDVGVLAVPMNAYFSLTYYQD